MNEDSNNRASSNREFYSQLSHHQQSQHWDGRMAATNLHKWFGLINDEFKLEVPNVAISVGVLPVSQLGSFHGEHNALGIQFEVSINSRYLNGKRPRWEAFATLTHQLLHAWQYFRGIVHPNYVHDAEFRQKASQIGLLITPQGLTGCIPDGPFVKLLASRGILVKQGPIVPSDLPSETAPPVNRSDSTSRIKGTSKLRKYGCGCTTARVAHRHFRAQCLNCGNEFLPDAATTDGLSAAPDES